MKDNFTSYDGFWSFYSNDITVWFEEYLKDEKKLETLFGSVLQFVANIEEITPDDIYGELTDENHINFEYNKETTS